MKKRNVKANYIKLLFDNFVWRFVLCRVSLTPLHRTIIPSKLVLHLLLPPQCLPLSSIELASETSPSTPDCSPARLPPLSLARVYTKATTSKPRYSITHDCPNECPRTDSLSYKFASDCDLKIRKEEEEIARKFN